MRFETLDFFIPGFVGLPEVIVYHTSTVEPQSHTWQLLPSNSEPNNAQRAPDGSAPLGKFTERFEFTLVYKSTPEAWARNSLTQQTCLRVLAARVASKTQQASKQTLLRKSIKRNSELNQNSTTRLRKSFKVQLTSTPQP